MLYEHHNFEDNNLKIIYHLDRVVRDVDVFWTHFHENIELLLVLHGSAEIKSGTECFIIQENEMAVISPNQLHSVKAVTARCDYYCLIVDHSIYDGFFPNSSAFPFKTNRREIVSVYRRIFETLNERQFFYREEVKSLVYLMLTLLLRQAKQQGITEQTDSPNSKAAMVKQAIAYMYRHFQEDIQVEDISNAIGFSKFYFCRCFKEITGQTPLWHLNYIRCRNARALLLSGKYNITESAIKSGFNNPSYFGKIYKKYFGCLPREEVKNTANAAKRLNLQE